MPLIQELDRPLLQMFLYREACDFWPIDGTEELQKVIKRGNYVSEAVRQIQSITAFKCNYVIIESLTDLGLKERQLQLTPSNDMFDIYYDMQILLPPFPFPRGELGVYKKKRRIK